MTLEKNLEAFFRRGVHAAGGWCLKNTSVAGIPDRLVLLPDGRVVFAELKTETGRLSKIQIGVIKKLRGLGMECVVLAGKQEIEEWLLHLTSTKN